MWIMLHSELIPAFVTHTKQQNAGDEGLIKLNLSAAHTANKDLSILGMISILIAAWRNPQAQLF